MAAEVFDKVPSVDEIAREVSRMKTTITEAVDEGVRSAMKAFDQGRRAAGDAIDDTKHAVKKNPLEAVGISFGAGLITGVLVTWVGLRCK